MPKFDKDELHRRVDEVLFYIWDPIGVCPTPSARWEYRSYSNKVVEMLQSGRDAVSVAKYLCDVQSGMMTLPADEIKVREVVDLLFSHKEAIAAERA